jgi:murein DD-endopeptidase MepM/ murein hydrolase activator NlpD
MKTIQRYHLPIDLQQVTAISKEGVAHVGDLIHSIDYDAPEGTPIMAALDGVVITVKDTSRIGGTDPKFEDDGNFIEVLHANGEISEYEHLLYDSANVVVGDHVTVGQVIAQVGNTGWSECPHLHFMVYPQGDGYKTREIRWAK